MRREPSKKHNIPIPFSSLSLFYTPPTADVDLVPCSYQDLAIEARNYWLSWNKAITEAGPKDLPEGLTPEDKLFYNCGCYFLAEGPELRDYYADSLTTMEATAPEFRKMQFVKVRASSSQGWTVL